MALKFILKNREFFWFIQDILIIMKYSELFQKLYFKDDQYQNFCGMIRIKFKLNQKIKIRIFIMEFPRYSEFYNIYG